MVPTIEFDNEFLLEAYEVDHVGSNGLLPSKLHAINIFSPEL